MHAYLHIHLPQRNELKHSQYYGHFPHAHTQTALQATIDKTLISCQSTGTSKHVAYVCVHVLRYICVYICVYTQCVCFILSVCFVWAQWPCSGKVSSAVCICKSLLRITVHLFFLSHILSLQTHRPSGFSSFWAQRRMLNMWPTSCSLSWMRSV